MNKVEWWVLLIALVGMGPDISDAANRYVRPGAIGTGAGSDWTNAYTNLPAKLIRGDTYYLADGSYGSHAFNDGSSGTSLIVIKKATQSDHGTDAGWSSTYGVGQAKFTFWQISGDYYLFDGQRRDTNWNLGAIGQYGISVESSGGIAARLDDAGSNFGDNLTFRFVNFQAGGRDTGRGDDVIYSNGHTGSGIGPQNVTFSKCAMHDSDRTIFLMRQWNNLLVEYSYIARNASSATTHGEILSDDGSDNVTFRFNVIEDPEGTAVWAILNGSGGAGGDASNWQIYGNVIFHTTGYNREGISGVVFCANDSGNNNSCSNWHVYNNTIWGIKGTWSGLVFQAGPGNIVQNNIWYKSVTTNNSGATFDYNWYYSTVAGSDSGSHKETCTSNCDIFSDASNKNFHLARSSGSAGAVLLSPFNTDMDGVTRAVDGMWDRGAFEFPGTAATGLPAPSNLRAIQ